MAESVSKMLEDYHVSSTLQREAKTREEPKLGEQLLPEVFQQVLREFATTDVYRKNAPTFFTIYAHNNPSAGKADAELAQNLIKWLDSIGCAQRSDRSPLGDGVGAGPHSASQIDEEQTHNILRDQLCLLLPDGHKKGVRKVIMICSEVLAKYHEASLTDPGLENFYLHIKEAYNRAQGNGGRVDNLQREIGPVVDNYCKKEGFHHVLTELAFLKIRHSEGRKEVILVILNGCAQSFNSLPYFETGTNIWLQLKMESSQSTAQQLHRPLHKLFFKILDKLYPLYQRDIEGLRSCYESCVKSMYNSVKHSGLPLMDDLSHVIKKEARKVIDQLLNDQRSILRTRRNPGNMHWLVDGKINSLFTGRAELVERIQHTLRSGHNACADQQRRFVITGIGGLGKSEICLKVAEDMREEFWGVFWVDVSSSSTAKTDFLTIAKALGLSSESTVDALRGISNIKENWLLILDNADDPNCDYQTYLPSGTYGSIIITSRLSDCSQYNTVGSEQLTGLNEKHSIQLLLKAARIPKESWSTHEQQAKTVTELLASHTLALITAGAYIATGHCRLDEYPQEFAKQRKRLLKYWRKQERSRYHDVYATFEASAEMLERSQNEEAKDALRLLEILSMLHPGNFPLQIFEDAWNGSREIISANITTSSDIYQLCDWHVSQLPDVMEIQGEEWDHFRLVQARNLLESLSIITHHDSTGLGEVSMHPLTHAWAKDRQSSKQQNQSWITTGSLFALSTNINYDTWMIKEILRMQILSYLDIKVKTVFSIESKNRTLPILLRSGWILLYMREDSRLDHFLKEIFEELDLNDSVLQEQFLLLYSLRARNLINLRQYLIAVKLLEQIVEVEKNIIDDSDRLHSQHELASAYLEDGQIEEAIKLFKHIVKVEEKLAQDHPSRLTSQHELARAYLKDGQIEEAIKLLEHVVEVEEKLAKNNQSRILSVELLTEAKQKKEEAFKG